jgi:hypothetical protein
LDPIETAIRNALRKGDAGDRVFRARVYRSAFNALHRVLEEGSGITPAEAAARRDNLKARIAEIEAEFAPATAAETSPPFIEASDIDVESASSAAPDIRAERRENAPQDSSSFEIDPRIERAADASPVYPDLGAPSDDGMRPAAKRCSSGHRRRSFATPLGALIVLALIVAGGWWALQGDLFPRDEHRGAPGWHPPQTLEEEGTGGAAEAPKKEGQADAEQRWITIFTPDDATTATAGAGAQAGVMQEGDAKFLRIVSGAQNGEVAFDVGKGILEQIAGKHALFDIVARAQEGKDTQMSVSCDFGALGTCDRKRYEVSNQRNDFLFEMDMPNASPSGAGRISVVSDIDKQGKAVDIYEIRVSTRQK